MNYAILTLTGTTVAQQMKEVARIVTGLVSTTADLLYATKAGSTVVIDAPTSNWSLAALTPLEGGTTATSAGYAFTAPCQTATKTKSALLCFNNVLVNGGSNIVGFSLMSGTGIAATAVPTTMAAGMTAITTVGSTAGSGMFGASAVTVAANLVPAPTNGAGFLTNQSTAPVTYAGTPVTNYSLNIASNKLYVFWSSSAIIIAVNGQVVQMVGEFVETNLTRVQENVPVCSLNANSIGYSSNTGGQNAATGAAAVNSAASIVFNNLYSFGDGLNAYRYAIGDGLQSGIVYNRTPSAVGETVDAAGNYLVMIEPLLMPMQSLGHGTINVSQLTNLYQTVNGAAGIMGDITTVAGSKFMTLTVTQGTYLVKIV